MHCEYLKFDEDESRIHLLSNIADDNLRSNIAQVCADNPDSTWDELGTKLFIALGCKSKAMLDAESSSLERREGENINSYAMRLRQLKVSTALATEDGEQFVKSQLFETYLLNDFLRGLRSEFMVSKAISKDATTVAGALLIIQQEMAKEHKKSIYTKGSNIALSADKSLFLNPSDAKYYANNSIYNEGELTLEGDLFDSQEIYYLQNDLCGRCGGARDHNGGSCRAIGIECHNCHKRDHFSRMCRLPVKQTNGHVCPFH